MSTSPAAEIAGMFTSCTLAFGVLVKAVRDHLPAEDREFFIESVMGQLRALEAAQTPVVAKYLERHRVLVTDFPAT